MSKFIFAGLLVLSSFGLFACEDQSTSGCITTRETGEYTLEERKTLDPITGDWVMKKVQVPIKEEVPCTGIESSGYDALEEEEALEQEAFERYCEKATNYSCEGVQPPELDEEE